MHIAGRIERAVQAVALLSSFLPFPYFAGAQGTPGALPTAQGAPPEVLYSPVADRKAVVTIGHARFTVLTPQLLRMEWAADSKFEDRASLVFLNRRLPALPFTAKLNGPQLTLDTGALQLSYNSAGASQGRFTAADLTIRFTVNGREAVWHPGMPDTGNLQGTIRTLDNVIGAKTNEAIGPGLISRDGWTLIDDSSQPLFDSDNFTFAKAQNSPWPWAVSRPPGDRQDWYFFGYGHDYRQALHDYVRVAGRIPLPPRFAFGTWWSRYWAYSDQELDDLIHSFRENNIPLDVLVIDMDWHVSESELKDMQEVDQSGHRLGWTGYTWNSLLFPEPEAFLAHVHHEGVKTVLNLHPASGIQPWEKAYPAMARAMSIDPATKTYVPFDITDKKFAINYLNILHHPLEHDGVDFWWLDWQRGTTTNVPGLSPTWWLGYVHFSDQQREGKRPLILNRWGGLGSHRYQVGFSGDTISVWESLAFQPWFTATAANVGYAYWSHDIGGHTPGVIDAELYTRWVQFGAFSPILRTHATKNPDAERRIWAYPEPYSRIMRDTIQLRHSLQPYLYTEARRTYDTGVAFLHPLYYDWPEVDAAYESKNEYVFGSQMVVAPVTKPLDPAAQLAEQSVWIPEGEWIERPTGKHFTGPARETRNFSIDQIPVYVRAGAVIPIKSSQPYADQGAMDVMTFVIFPLLDGQTSAYAVYADDGKAEDYKLGACTWTKLLARQSGDSLSIQIAPVEGSYPGMINQQAYQVELPGDWPPQAVTVNHKSLLLAAQEENGPGWRYDGNTLTTIITTPQFSVHTPVRIDIRRTAGSLASRPNLDGFAGSIARLRSAYDTLNLLWPSAWSPDRLTYAWQTGDRLSYHPETARREIELFPRTYDEALAEVRNLINQSNVRANSSTHADGAGSYTHYLNLVKTLLEQWFRGDHPVDTEKVKSEREKLYLHRAEVLLTDGKPAPVRTSAQQMGPTSPSSLSGTR